MERRQQHHPDYLQAYFLEVGEGAPSAGRAGPYRGLRLQSLRGECVPVRLDAKGMVLSLGSDEDLEVPKEILNEAVIAFPELHEQGDRLVLAGREILPPAGIAGKIRLERGLPDYRDDVSGNRAFQNRFRLVEAVALEYRLSVTRAYLPA